MGAAMTTTHLNVSIAADVSADIKAVDLASQTDGGDGVRYLVMLKAGARPLTEGADVAAISLAGSHTLTIKGRARISTAAMPTAGSSPIPVPRRSRT
jgi:hypothetical protein